MQSDEKRQSRRGPAAMLALFLTVLLGNPVPAVAIAETGEAAVAQTRSGKAALATRSTKREADRQLRSTDLPPLHLGVPPQVVTEYLSSRPAGPAGRALAHAVAGTRASPFDARAPPAA